MNSLLLYYAISHNFPFYFEGFFLSFPEYHMDIPYLVICTENRKIVLHASVSFICLKALGYSVIDASIKFHCKILINMLSDLYF